MENAVFYQIEMDQAQFGTNLKGYIQARFKDLVKCFDLPNESDGYKSSGEWVFQDNLGNEFTIYDWKKTCLYDSDYPSVKQFRSNPEKIEFNIGGNADASEFIAWIEKCLARVKYSDLDIILEQDSGYEVSSKYKVINTGKVLEAFASKGYTVKSTSIANTRIIEKRGFQKHCIRLVNPELSLGIEGLEPEIILTNSYDKASSLKLNLGVYRFVCANGLVTGKSFFEARIKHIGADVYEQVERAIVEAQLAMIKVASTIKAMQSVKLSDEAIVDLSREVGHYLLDDKKPLFIAEQGLRQRRRSEDLAQDLWTVFNVIQENAIKGNLRYINEQGKNSKCRAIKAIDRLNKINQDLFDLAIKRIA